MAKILLKRGQSENISSVTLGAAEPAFTVDTGKLYVGNGTENILINPDKVQASDEADKLKEAKEFSVDGDVVAQAVEFDGTGNVVLNASLKATGVTAGSYAKVTVSEKGLVTAADQLSTEDIPNLPVAKIVETDDKQFISVDAKQKLETIDEVIEDGDTFHTDMVTVNALGGIAAGEDLNNMPIAQVLTKLLYPYVAPTISGSSNPNGGTFEKGNTQNVTRVSATVGKKSEKITKVEVFDGATSLGVKTGEEVQNGGSFSFDVSLGVNTNKNLQVKATDTTNKVVSANTGSFNFVYPYYAGVCAAGAEITQDLVKGLSKRIEGKGNKTLVYTCNNESMIIAYPASHGNLKQIFDANNFDVTGTFVKKTVAVVGLDGASVDYAVYVNNASTVSNFTMKFNY